MVQYCAVPGCRGNALMPGISFHSFPNDPTLKKLWKIKIRRDKGISTSMRICSEHFLPSDYRVPLTGRRKLLKKDAIPSIFAFNKIQSSCQLECSSNIDDFQQALKASREVKGTTLVTKENTRKNYDVFDEYFDGEENERFNITKTADISINKIALPSLSLLNLHSFMNENISEIRLQTVNPISKLERLDSESLIIRISDKENANFNSVQEQNICAPKKCFTYEDLVENILLLKKPNIWWSVSSVNNFIICVRWNDEYLTEKKVVIESTLTVRVFLKEMEINITDFMDITCIEDISNLLERVETYKTLVDAKKL